MLLLELGADINKKTGLGLNSISVAAKESSYQMIQILVNKGARAQINERLNEGKTALHLACEDAYTWEDRIHALFTYGADPNIFDDYGDTPLMVQKSFDIEEVMIKELAIYKFLGRSICDENLEYLLEEDSIILFEDCLQELQRMKNHKFYKSFTLFDVLQCRAQCKKLTFLSKNPDFVAAFNSVWKRESFKHYCKCLDIIFNDAVENRDALKLEENKLYTIFKKYLPELVIHKLAYFVNEDLFFKVEN